MSAASRSLVIATTYVTEACARQSLAALEGTPATLLYNYVDQAYGRSSYCVGGAPRAVAETVVALATDAIARVDVRAAAGTHPQIGAVDHVAVNPLGDDLETAAATAHLIARRLGRDANLPTLLYGAARADGRGLAATRRLTPYFGEALSPAFDAGPADADPRTGMACVGACPHVLNYNVVLDTSDGAAARRVARAVRARDGGLPHVEALALAHGDVYEVACNLLDAEATPPAAVLDAAERAAAASDVRVARAYHIGLTKPEMRAILARGGGAAS